MTTEASASRFIHRIGKFARPHGLDGHLQLRLFRDRRIDDVGRLRKASSPQPVEIETPDGTLKPDHLTSARWLDGARAVVRLASVPDRTAAEALEGGFLDVDPRRPPGLLCDRWDALVDAEVLGPDGPLGRVETVRSTGAHPLLVVGEDELLIPAVDAFVQTERSEGGEWRVHVSPIPGLLEANAPDSDPRGGR
jgi:ribosomal 30S subunit maturation factor RimM